MDGQDDCERWANHERADTHDFETDSKTETFTHAMLEEEYALHYHPPVEISQAYI